MPDLGMIPEPEGPDHCAPSIWTDASDENDDSRGGALRGVVFMLPIGLLLWGAVAFGVWMKCCR